MIKAIGINREHENILDTYILTVCESVKDVTTETKYNNFLDVVEIIVKYHNEYGDKKLGAYSDFMSIIPTNLTSCFRGFLAGVENNKNRSACRVYKTLLTELSYKIIEDLEKLKIEKD